jgi:hypothetical protein
VRGDERIRWLTHGCEAAVETATEASAGRLGEAAAAAAVRGKRKP